MSADVDLLNELRRTLERLLQVPETSVRWRNENEQQQLVLCVSDGVRRAERILSHSTTRQERDRALMWIRRALPEARLREVLAEADAASNPLEAA